MSIWKFYFSFNGRISRSQLWFKGIPLLVGTSLFLYLISIIKSIELYKSILLIIIYPILFLNSWSIFVLMIKRIHDRNKSFWYPLEKYADLPKPNTIDYLFLGVIFIVFIILFFYMILLWIWLFIIEVPFLKGTNGPNYFGPDPLNSE